MTESTIRNQVIEVIEKICGFRFDETGCSDDDDLLKNGVLDSSAFIQTLMGIAKATDIELIDEDIMNPENTTITGLCKLVATRQGEPTSQT